MSAPLNSHAVIAPQLSATCLADIEGLNPTSVGFCRGECAAVPANITGSFETLTSHLFIGTPMPATAWDKHATNVDGYGTLMKKFKTERDGKVTVFHQGDETADQVSPLLFFKQIDNQVSIVEYSNVTPGDLPFESKGALAVDRSDTRYVFVCAHRVRDERCGYCGPILVELIRKAAAARFPTSRIRVYACSHIGGHVYAGNVLCYSKHGGRCFGCITPADLDSVVDYVATHSSAAVPSELKSRLRGSMVPLS